MCGRAVHDPLLIDRLFDPSFTVTMPRRIAILGASGAVGSALAVHILRARLLEPADQLLLVGRGALANEHRLLSMRVDLLDAFDDQRVHIEVVPTSPTLKRISYWSPRERGSLQKYRLGVPSALPIAPFSNVSPVNAYHVSLARYLSLSAIPLSWPSRSSPLRSIENA